MPTSEVYMKRNSTIQTENRKENHENKIKNN